MNNRASQEHTLWPRRLARSSSSAKLSAAALAFICCAVSFAIWCMPQVAQQASAADSAEQSSQIESISDLSGKTIGAQVGSIGYDCAEEYCKPDGQVLGFNTTADLLQALSGNKIDAFVNDEPAVQYALVGRDGYKVLDGYLGNIQYGFMFPLSGANADLQYSQFQDFLAKIKADGTLDEIWDTWCGADDSKKHVDYNSLEGENGTIRLATSSSSGPPTGYVKDSGYAGVDIDILARFCEAYGYKLKISDMDTSGVIASLTTGKADIGCFGATITEERAQSVRFSSPYYDGGMVAVVNDTAAASQGVFGSLAEGFKRTFIEEDRWVMFAQGATTTLIISILSILLGTILGFLAFLFVRKGGKIRNKIIDFCIWLISGMPAVVLLMVLFYIVFATAPISGTAVAVIAFTLTFAASMIGMLRVGEDAIDGGQSEAAQALGYTEARAFREIILPQAIRHILPTYQSEAITLLKGTAVVGYIAVRDLTKVGDIVRSATYDAFFPLIAVAIAYFVLEACIKRIIRFIEKRMERNAKNAGGILKGVKQEVNPSYVLTESDLEFINSNNAPRELEKTELVRFEDVEKKFGDNVILEHVNASLYTGDVISIIGPSGCGKSTLMRTINLLGPATSGKVYLKGEDIMAPGYDTRKLYREVGMVFQRWNLFNHWTILENLMRPRMDLCGSSAQEAYDVAMRQLRFMGLRDKAFSYPSELSGGQQQRIAILRAFVTQPSIVLMDEPTSALDPLMVGEIQEAIIGLSKRGMTMMIVSHDMKFSRAVCNRVFYMDEKGIYEDSTPEKIFTAPERPKTREFISQMETLRISVTPENRDTVDAYADIDAFLAARHAGSAQSLKARAFYDYVVERKLLPALSGSFALDTVVAYNEDNGNVLLCVWFSGDPLPKDAIDKAVAPYVSEYKYAQVEEGAFTNRLDAIIRGERLTQ